MSIQISTRMAILAASTYATFLLPALAADIDNGHKIAERWCASCHSVTPDQKRVNTDAPSFTAIAAKFRIDKELATFLASPYPRMPDMALAQPEIADLVAYIRSLGTT